MLALTFQVGSDYYAVDSSCVIEVIPWVNLRLLPHAPPHLKGLLYYRGQVAPVIDLAMLLASLPCAARLNTRIIVARRSVPSGGSALLGLLAERISDLIKVTADTFLPQSVAVPAAPFLGPVIKDNGRLVQVIQPDFAVPEILTPQAEAVS